VCDNKRHKGVSITMLKRHSAKLSLPLDLRVLCLVLLAVIVGMLIVWKPWQADTAGSRKITIRGEATVKAEPDQFQFSPAYERPTVEEISVLSEQMTAKLKEIGVAEKDIKVNANAYDKYVPAPRPEGGSTPTNYLSLRINAYDKAQAQKIQDYLVTTNPTGSITPYPTFSTEKRKSLEDEARGKALEDARKRAAQTAAGLDAKVGKVMEIKEGVNVGGVMPYLNDAVAMAPEARSSSSLPVSPGENEYAYSVEVIFALR
jgi:uncharacterized protein